MIGISLLEADLLYLAEELDQLVLAGVDCIYIDFLSCRKTTGMVVGPKVCRSLRDHGIRCPIKVLLKAGVSETMIQSLHEAGADQVIVDASMLKRIDVKSISTGCMGVSITPDLSIEHQADHLSHLDIVLIQVDDNHSTDSILDYVRQVKLLLGDQDRDIKLAISGDFERHDIAALAGLGIDIFVFGKSVFSSDDYYTSITLFKRQISAGRDF